MQQSINEINNDNDYYFFDIKIERPTLIRIRKVNRYPLVLKILNNYIFHRLAF